MTKIIKQAGLITTSTSINKDLYGKVDNSIDQLNKIGFEIKKSDNFYDNYFGSGGTGENRGKALNNLYNNNLELIICAQGGNTANQMLDYINFDLIREKNIPLIGFSDNTVLLNAISNISGNNNYLGPDLIWKFGSNFTEYDKKEFVDIFINKRNYTNLLDGRLIKNGDIYNGRLWGGNIRCFLKLFGTKFFPNINNGILLIEEVNKDSLWWESIIKYLIHTGIINKLNGIILGHCHNFISLENEKIEELFYRKLKGFDKLFIYKTNSFGHKSNHSLFLIGSESYLNFKENKIYYE